MPLALPPELAPGYITGRFIVAAEDGPDSGLENDAYAAAGKVTAKALHVERPFPELEGSPVFFMREFNGYLDAEGYVTRGKQPDPMPEVNLAIRGMQLPPGQWNVVFNIDNGPTKKFLVTLAPGEVRSASEMWPINDVGTSRIRVPMDDELAPIIRRVISDTGVSVGPAQLDAAIQSALDDLNLSGGGPQSPADERGVNVGRFIRRAQAGEALKVVAIGDSVLEGHTVDHPSTDGAVARLPVQLGERFPKSTFTSVNQAVSGYTTAASFANSRVSVALAEKGDLYLISFGKNDNGWERAAAGSLPVPGYPKANSLAMLARMVRLIRSEVPKADIVIMGENPYAPASSSANPFLVSWTDGARGVAATYGCEFVDGYQPFIDSDTPLAALVPDGTHPNTEGHQILADAVMDHMPANYKGIAASPGSQSGPDPQGLNPSNDRRGWQKLTPGVEWTNTSGFTGSSPAVATEPGHYAEFAFDGTELLLQLSTASDDAPVVDVTVDGSSIYASKSLTNGKTGSSYLVPIALDLSASPHVARVTLRAGTLRLYDAYTTLTAPPAAASVATFDLTAAANAASQSTFDLDPGGAAHLMVNTVVPLPSGWEKMAVSFAGNVQGKVSGVTTAPRLLNVNLRMNGAASVILQQSVPPRSDTESESYVPFVIQYAETSASDDLPVRLEMRAQGADKSQCRRGPWSLQAIRYRLA